MHKGNWQFDADQLVGFEQHLKVMVKENDQNKLIQTLTIPAAKQTLTQQQIENLLMNTPGVRLFTLHACSLNIREPTFGYVYRSCTKAV